MSDLSGVVDMSGSLPYFPPKQHIITLDELLESYTVVAQKEASDKTLVNGFLNPGAEDVRPKLFEWARAGFPNIYTLQTLSMTPPVTCADGEARNVIQYAEYLTNKTIPESISTLQGKMPGLEVTMSHSANSITLHVSRGV